MSPLYQILNCRFMIARHLIILHHVAFLCHPILSKTRIEALFSEYTYAHTSSNPRTENAKLITKATDSVPIPLLQYRSLSSTLNFLSSWQYLNPLDLLSQLNE